MDIKDHEPKVVAEFTIGGPIAFNSEINDIIDEEPDPSLIDDKPKELEVEIDPPVDPPKDPVNVEPPVDPPVDSEDKTDEEYDDFSEAALFATALKERRPDLFNEIEKDLKPEDFLDHLEGYLDGVLKQGEDIQLDTFGKYREWMEYVIGGGNPQVAEEAITGSVHANLDVSSEETTEEQLETVVRAMYEKKDIPKEDIDDIVTTLKDTGKLKVRAEQSVSYFEAEEKNKLARAKAELADRKKAQEEYENKQKEEIDTIIGSGDILGMNLDVKDQKEFRSWLFDATETIEVQDPKTGKVVTQRVTPSYKALQEFNTDIKKNLAFQKLLMDGFNLEKIKKHGKKERDSEVLDILNKRNARTSTSKNERTYTRNYSRPVAEYDA